MIKQKNENWVNREYFSKREVASIRKASSCKIKQIDRDAKTALFSGSSSKPYETSLLGCTCPHYSKISNPVPCKHMFKLASELGLFTIDSEFPYKAEHYEDGTDILSLYERGEFYPEQYFLFYNDDLNCWLFAIRNPVDIVIPKRKGVYESIIAFSLNLKDLNVFLFPLKKPFDLAEADFDSFVGGGHIGTKYIVFNGNSCAGLIAEEETEKIDCYEHTDSVFVDSPIIFSFKIPTAFFFKTNYYSAYSEVKGHLNDKNWKSEIFLVE